MEKRAKLNVKNIRHDQQYMNYIYIDQGTENPTIKQNTFSG